MGEKRSPLSDRWFLDQIAVVMQQFQRAQPDSEVPDTPGAPRHSGHEDLTARAARLSAQRARLEQEEAALQADVERLNHAPAPGPAPRPPRSAPVPDLDISADDLTLTEAGRIRRAYKITEAALPRLVLEAAADGLDAPAIARGLAVTPSYVYRILRERVRYTWRLDVRDGGTWAVRSSGQDVVHRALGSETRLAEKLLAESGADRVLLWEGSRTTDAQAILDLARPEGD
ncbi:hypothetical protein OEIGOIKO_05026 [Streptomyces chrestomyceticus JCM 4735]|uniref:Uncharacterized protein n=1 Tax=Streptomyces chrestomyceticus JCM 4735 TaxID=1306181 RepID=A0A7U9KXN4_9ACTN|nr:hypothetical protein [Streptomyces chrestomyceticus]GCD37241.1 hypothetical protein OEIGOIKO_05026 [Streptomyces chrestomyceticus JCM 4735]